jgi:hypothetical protein
LLKPKATTALTVSARRYPCPFCGKPLSKGKKNFEHIIPKWLVKEADLLKRLMPIYIGGRQKEVPMKDIGLQSCIECNQKFSDLESKARDAFMKLAHSSSIDSSDTELLLNWLDKIRVGMWLWTLQIYKDKFRVKPTFGINLRTRQKDRIFSFVRYAKSEDQKGLGFFGIGKAYMFMPTTLGLHIHNIFIISASHDAFLLEHIYNRKYYKRPFIDDHPSRAGSLSTAVEFAGEMPEGTRIRLLGQIQTYGQCIQPEGLIGTNVDDFTSRRNHTGFFMGRIFALDNCLKILNSEHYIINSNNKTNHLLMQMNVSLLNLYFIKNFLASDLSSIQKEGDWRRLYGNLLAEELSIIKELEISYYLQTGISINVLH